MTNIKMNMMAFGRKLKNSAALTVANKKHTNILLDKKKQ